jgi:hypothetical protein
VPAVAAGAFLGDDPAGDGLPGGAEPALRCGAPLSRSSSNAVTFHRSQILLSSCEPYSASSASPIERRGRGSGPSRRHTGSLDHSKATLRHYLPGFVSANWLRWLSPTIAQGFGRRFPIFEC